MTRLERFQITNYRSCVNTTLELPLNLTCLIGVNGVGKTNLLNGIQLLRKIKTGYQYASDNDAVGFKTTISANFRIDNKTVKMKCKMVYDTDDRNNDVILSATMIFDLKEFTGEAKKIEFPAEILNYIEISNTTQHMINQRHFLIDRFFKPFEGDIIIKIRNYIKRMSYYSASQFSDPTKCPISFELEENKSHRLGRQNIYHEKFLNDLYLTYKNNKSLFSKFLSTVNKEGIGLVDNITFGEHDMPSSLYEVKSGGKIKKIDKNRQLIIPNVTIDNIQLSPNQLSEGTFKTLALVFYIITDDNDLLLIEEPEVCVHHGLLNSIISLIITQSKKKQIIISTHSDYVLDKLAPENLVIVNKKQDKGTVAKPLSNALSKNDYKALKNYLSNTGNLGEYWKEGGFGYE